MPNIQEINQEKSANYEYPAEFRDPADGLEIFEGTLAAFLAEDYFDNASAEPLAPEYAAVYKIELWLPAATGNGYQGSEFLGNLTVEAVQSDNQTSGDIKWSESGE